MPPLVLIVEDDAPIRDLFQRLAIRAGCQTLSVRNGTEALQVLRSESPNLILLDLGLPGGVTGEAILEYIDHNAHLEATRIVVVSAYPQGIRPIPNLARVSAVITKPVRPVELVHVIEEYTRA